MSARQFSVHEAVSTDSRVAKATATIAVWNAASRVTGFVRVLAVGGALGATYLGNTYQSSNLVSNLLFELLAAGLLAAPLVPLLVGLAREESDRLLGSLLGLALVVLGVVALVGALAGTLLMRAVVGGAPGEVRGAQIALGAFWLWFFLPQLLLYATGAVATAWLHAQKRFAAASAAPVLNNLTVVATMAVFTKLHDGPRGLALDTAEKLVLGIGTTLGVALMSALPLVAAVRAGATLRPRWEPRDPSLREVGRRGRWGAIQLAVAQVLIGTTLVLANRVEGGVVAYQIAFVFFLLPFALVAHPVATSLFPELAERAQAGDLEALSRRVRHGVRLLVATLALSSLGIALLGRPVLSIVRLGALDAQAVAVVSRVLTAYALGLAGYGVFFLLARAFAALGDMRTPALVGAGVALVGGALMVGGVAVSEGSQEVVALGLAHSAAFTGGAAALYVLLRHRLGRMGLGARDVIDRAFVTRPLGSLRARGAGPARP